MRTTLVSGEWNVYTHTDTSNIGRERPQEIRKGMEVGMAEHPCDLSYLLKAGGLQAEGHPGQLGQETLSQNKRTGLNITVVSPCLPPTRSWVQSQHCSPKKGEMQGKTPRGWGGRTSLCMTWIQPYRGKQDEWDHLGSLGTKHQVSPACSHLSCSGGVVPVVTFPATRSSRNRGAQVS